LRKFAARGFAGVQSMNDGDHYCQLKKDSLNTYEYATGKYVSGRRYRTDRHEQFCLQQR
jgi:hypothetical protein